MDSQQFLSDRQDNFYVVYQTYLSRHSKVSNKTMKEGKRKGGGALIWHLRVNNPSSNST